MEENDELLKFSTIVTYQKRSGTPDCGLLTFHIKREDDNVILYTDVTTLNEYHTIKSTYYDVDVNLVRDAWFELRPFIIPSLMTYTTLRTFYNSDARMSARLSCVFGRPVEVYPICDCNRFERSISTDDICIKTYPSYKGGDDVQLVINPANFNARQDIMKFDADLIKLFKG